MIEIEASLLSQAALEAIIEEVILRHIPQETEEPHVAAKKYQLQQKIQHGLAVIVYDAKAHFCDILPAEEFKMKSMIFCGR